MCSRSFTVVLDNTIHQKFNVRVENFTSDSFLRLLRLGLAISEIEDECKFDNVVYDNWRNINYNNIIDNESIIYVYKRNPMVLQTPNVKIRKVENPPQLQGKNNVKDHEEEVETVADEEDDSHVERIFCHVCFGFDSTTENPIILCDALGRTCDVGYHKKCKNIRNVSDSFFCDTHKNSNESRKRGRALALVSRKIF